MDKHPASGTRRKPRTPLTQEQQGLARSYIPFAKKIAAPLRDCWPSNAKGVRLRGRRRLGAGCQSFNRSRGVKFATFARYRIWGALKDMQRGMNLKGFKQVQDGPKVEGLTEEAEGYGTILNTTPDCAIEDVVEERDWLERIFRTLPKLEREICTLIYLEGWNQKRVCAALNISRTHVSVIHARALKKLAETLEQRMDRAS